MKTLKKKLNQAGGFTLVEMLVVVGIIAVLVAVSIPVVSSSMEKAQHATDAANERSAKAEMLIRALANNDISNNVVCYYDAAKGSIEPAATNIAGYGKHTRTGTGAPDHKGKILALKLSNSEVLITWTGTGASATTSIDASETTLCSGKEAATH